MSPEPRVVRLHTLHGEGARRTAAPGLSLVFDGCDSTRNMARGRARVHADRLGRVSLLNTESGRAPDYGVACTSPCTFYSEHALRYSVGGHRRRFLAELPSSLRRHCEHAKWVECSSTGDTDLHRRVDRQVRVISGLRCVSPRQHFAEILRLRLATGSWDWQLTRGTPEVSCTEKCSHERHAGAQLTCQRR